MIVQVITCLGGAACLHSAIDLWLAGHPHASALFSFLALVNAHGFVVARSR